MAEAPHILGARHIQNMSEAKALEPHWGYAERAVPCTNDPGSCEYLDLVYWAHDMGMLYSGILWITIGGIIFLWALYYQSSRATVEMNSVRRSGTSRLGRTIASALRRHLLPDSVRAVFGRTTRFQVVMLTAFVSYVTIWSFVGLTWHTWVTPVKNMPGVYNTRTSLGPWSDRIGILAYALTPLSIMLANRESLLSLLTGVPYQSFNFMHRWLGYVIFAQSSLHTISWCVVEIRLYQPQPTVGIEWIKQTYMIWGLVAMILLLLLVVLSTPWGIRMTGYETFRKLHYILAMVYIGTCWAHWDKLNCFMIPSLILWFLDRAIRLFRTGYLHYNPSSSGGLGFKSNDATITMFPDPEHGDIYRLDLENSNQDPWAIGQHYYLCFPESSIWQSHPFTPLNAPRVQNGSVKHSYIIRAKKGETKKIAQLAAKKQQASSETSTQTTIPVILTGAYGERIMEHIAADTNILCVAGGTGVTYVLPVLLELARYPTSSKHRQMHLIWAVRHSKDAAWIQEELDVLRQAACDVDLKISIFATRDAKSKGSSTTSEKKAIDVTAVSKEAGSSGSSANEDDAACQCDMDLSLTKMGGGEDANARHPALRKLVPEFIEGTVSGPTVVVASGPGGMISDLRTIVAGCNSAGKVWKGQDRFDVRLICDDRLEW